MNAAVHACIAGDISPQVMLARLVMAGDSDAAIQQALAPHPDLLAFFHAHRAALPRLRELASRVDHTRFTSPADIAAQFDAALAVAPEASVAAYSLGDPALLHAATVEIVSWLRTTGLFAPGMRVLDLGCGIGRIAAALAPHTRSVLGLDVAPGMVAEARRRHTAPNLRFDVTDGRSLAALPDAGFDLILAADTFPYLLLAGPDIARSHIDDGARLLRPNGSLVLLNLSYAPNPSADTDRVTAWAHTAGLRAELRDPRPFRLWDAHAFVFRRPTLVRGETAVAAPRTDVAQQQSEGFR
jgi:SAM-dependent methyltransferase